MRLEIFTIVLDGMPFIGSHLPVLNSLGRFGIDWRWTIAEGAAMNRHCTAWCAEQLPRLSSDGTLQYLYSISHHPRVYFVSRPSWDGKIEQCNWCVQQIDKPCILLQMDVDEIWTAESLAALVDKFEDETIGEVRINPRYYVGPNIIVTSKGTWGAPKGGLPRAWRFNPGQKFITHEPPVLDKINGLSIEILGEDANPQHYGYVTVSQVRYKEEFYGYVGALARWKWLQQNKHWPVNLGIFFPWVTDDAIVNKLYE